MFYSSFVHTVWKLLSVSFLPPWELIGFKSFIRKAEQSHFYSINQGAITKSQPKSFVNKLVYETFITPNIHRMCSNNVEVFGSFGLSTKEPYTYHALSVVRQRHHWHQCHHHLCTPPPGIETAYLVFTVVIASVFKKQKCFLCFFSTVVFFWLIW